MTTTRPAFNPKAVTLANDKITLKPMSLDDSLGFYQAGNYPQLWQWVKPNQCRSLETARQWIKESLVQQAHNQQVPFVIIDNAANKIVGSTRYCAIRHDDRNLEVGYTFITPEYQRSYVNTNAKFLLLQHAFESLGAIRVEIKTREENHQSRNAIARIGATFEGMMRNHKIFPDGAIKHSAIFSVIESEWPDVKQALLNKLESYETPAA